MNINANQTASGVPLQAGPNGPRTPEAAAEQFEQVLVKQFVQEMTKGLFDQSLAGDQGPGWVDSYSQQQGEVMTDVLAEHLVDSGAMGIKEMLLRQWGVQTAPSETPELPPDQPAMPTEPPLRRGPLANDGLTMG